MGIRALESVLKLTSDTSQFEAGLKRAGEATKVLEKNVKNTFNDPILMAGMKVAGYAMERMAATSERMKRNALEWSPMAIREQALADVAGMRADIVEGNADGGMAAQAARIARMRAEQRISNIQNPTWASRPGSFWSDPFGFLERKYDAFSAATDITNQRFEQATGLPGFLAPFTSEGLAGYGQVMNAIENGGTTPQSPWDNPANGFGAFGSVGVGISGFFWMHKALSSGGG